jgi:hypothetical protein
MKNNLFKTGLVVGIIVLLIGVSITSSTGKVVSTTCKTTNFNGSLLGYVNDTSGNPIEGALVRVYFHESYEEDYSDSTGYYHVTSIPICYCMKDTVCSKSDYKTEQVSLAIAENTVYDFILTPDEAITSSLSESEDCIECQVSDGISLLRAKILLFRVKVVTNVILSSKLGEIPEIKEDCQKILDVINSDEPLYDRPICYILESILYSIVNLMINIGHLIDTISNDFIINQLEQMLFFLQTTGTLLLYQGAFIGCWALPL